MPNKHEDWKLTEHFRVNRSAFKAAAIVKVKKKKEQWKPILVWCLQRQIVVFHKIKCFHSGEHFYFGLQKIEFRLHSLCIVPCAILMYRMSARQLLRRPFLYDLGHGGRKKENFLENTNPK